MFNPFEQCRKPEKFTSTGTRRSNLNLQTEYKVSGDIPNYQVELEVTYRNILITKARKRLHFMKIISSQPWCQDTKTLVHLSIDSDQS